MACRTTAAGHALKWYLPGVLGARTLSDSGLLPEGASLGTKSKANCSHCRVLDRQ